MRLPVNKPTQQNLFQPEQLPDPLMPWEQAAAEDQLSVNIVFNRPLETVFHYLVPDDLRDIVGVGQRVKAPFGRGDRPMVGFCVGLGPPPKTGRKLKTIEAVIDRCKSVK